MPPPHTHLLYFFTRAHAFDRRKPPVLFHHYQVTNDLVSGCYIKMECVFQSWWGGGHILEASVKAEESLERADTRTHILGVMLAPNFFTPKGQLLFIFFYFIDILSVSYFARQLVSTTLLDFKNIKCRHTTVSKVCLRTSKL